MPNREKTDRKETEPIERTDNRAILVFRPFGHPLGRGRIASIRSLGLSSCLVILAILFQSTAYADDWPQWLGPKRDGVWRETETIRSFPADGPKVRWRRQISSGYVGPAVAQGRVYVIDRVAESGNPATEQRDHYGRRNSAGTERVLCLRESDGEILWKHEYDCPYSVAYPAGPRATPTVHQGKVYTLGTEGNIPGRK